MPKLRRRACPGRGAAGSDNGRTTALLSSFSVHFFRCERRKGYGSAQTQQIGQPGIRECEAQPESQFVNFSPDTSLENKRCKVCNASPKAICSFKSVGSRNLAAIACSAASIFAGK